MRLIKIQGSAPRPPSSMGRGAVTPVTDLKRRTIIQYPYTEEAEEGMWRTPTQYYTVPDRSIPWSGQYTPAVDKRNDWRRMVGQQEKPEITVRRTQGYPDEEVMAHEYGHKSYFEQPVNRLRWMMANESSTVDIKDKAWESYGTEEQRKVWEEEDKYSFRPTKTAKQAESYARTAETPAFYEVLPSDQREKYFGRLYDEVKVQQDRKDRLAVVNPANVQQPKQAQAQAQDQRTSWANSRKGEY